VAISGARIAVQKTGCETIRQPALRRATRRSNRCRCRWAGLENTRRCARLSTNSRADDRRRVVLVSEPGLPRARRSDSKASSQLREAEQVVSRRSGRCSEALVELGIGAD
jgi:hypothetical protein